MFRIEVLNEEFAPQYATLASAGADLRAAHDEEIPPQSVRAIGTGVRILGVDLEQLPEGVLPELQIRARSGLAAKHSVWLANGVGTVDADYRQEIKVLLWNASSTTSFKVQRGDRIAQLVAGLVHRLDGFTVGGERKGGFGSTGTR